MDTVPTAMRDLSTGPRPGRTPPELTLVIPTYNERSNIRPLTERIAAALDGIDWEVIFVDDDSPDGTGEEVRAVARDHPGVRLLHRIGRRGLAGACVEGILAAGAEVVAVMDADLQHDERILPRMFDRFAADRDLDLVVGSRNLAAPGEKGGLSPLRQKGSDLATWLARKILSIDVSDPMSGFFMVRRETFNSVVLELQPDGFKILADMLSNARGRWKVEEIGYRFRERQLGESKMNTTVTLEFLGLLVARATRGLVSIRFVLFALIGLTGVFVQLAAVGLALATATESFAIAQSFGVFTAMTTNFFLNNELTYRDRKLRGLAVIRGLLSFYLVCSIGAFMNVSLANGVFALWPNWVVASTAGAFIGALWNFLASAVLTWRAR
jgi:dolichol-phosphate mannosyltransferase